MKNKLLTLIASLLFLAGAAIFLYPYCMDWYYEYQTKRIITGYKNELEGISKQMANGTASSSDQATNQTQENITDSISESTEKLDKLYDEMALYNERIYENNQKDLTDPFSYESASFDLTEYGLADNLFGYLTISAMDLELPIYLGATNENLAKGAVHLGLTSMPIGGINTNSVLAAHRGYRGIPMFRDIQKLKTGDMVTITTPFDTLNYEVVKTTIILPEEIDKVLIQPGRDMLTLFTCHPYRQNSHRYVVYCERTYSSENPQGQAVDSEIVDSNVVGSKEETSTPQAENSTGNLYSSNGEDMENGISQSEKQILLDKYVPIVGVAILFILFIICLIIPGKNKS